MKDDGKTMTRRLLGILVLATSTMMLIVAPPAAAAPKGREVLPVDARTGVVRAYPLGPYEVTLDCQADPERALYVDIVLTQGDVVDAVSASFVCREARVASLNAVLHTSPVFHPGPASMIVSGFECWGGEYGGCYFHYSEREMQLRPDGGGR